MADTTGIICEQCGHSEWSVKYSRKLSGEIERRRKCLHCGSRVTTSEQVKRKEPACKTRQ